MTVRWRPALVFFILLFAFSGYQAVAQQQDGPKMVLKNQEFDAKEVKEGETIEHAFHVLNQGNQPLQIKDVKPG